jgi:hypothetical protein
MMDCGISTTTSTWAFVVKNVRRSFQLQEPSRTHFPRPVMNVLSPLGLLVRIKYDSFESLVILASGVMDSEVAPITIAGKKGNVVISKDEGIDTFEPTKMAKLR